MRSKFGAFPTLKQARTRLKEFWYPCGILLSIILQKSGAALVSVKAWGKDPIQATGSGNLLFCSATGCMKTTGCKKMARLAAATFITLAASLPTPSILADTYFVNRSLSDSSGDMATLVGTRSIPEGNYTLTNKPPSPFTAATLTLTVNGTPYSVNNVLTDLISGTGIFSITASPTALIFSAHGNGGNPADLVFSDQLNSQLGIGTELAPMGTRLLKSP
jgi:hypothetical protein